MINSIIFSTESRSGGTKSLYTVSEALSRIGRSSIATINADGKLADWFRHGCQYYDGSYRPDVVVYPEVFQPPVSVARFKICFALGQYSAVKAHADLVACKSRAVQSWVKKSLPEATTVIIPPSIDLSVFEYDGREKKIGIAYMRRPHKSPQIGTQLKERYGSQVVEIVNRTEQEVAEILKFTKVFVWRGNDKEGSPRPPKEALAAGCIVVGLEQDLNSDYFTDFGVRCRTEDEILEMAGQCLRSPGPMLEDRSILRDISDEQNDWVQLVQGLFTPKDAHAFD